MLSFGFRPMGIAARKILNMDEGLFDSNIKCQNHKMELVPKQRVEGLLTTRRVNWTGKSC
jgi:hypothetical protein